MNIRLYDSSNKVHILSDLKNGRIEHTEDGCDKLSFLLDTKNPDYALIKEERKIVYGDNNWTIKKIQDDSIVCEIDFDFLKGSLLTNYSYQNALLSNVLTELLPTGWEIIRCDICTTIAEQSYKYATPYEVIYDCMKVFDVRFVWKTKKKQLIVRVPSKIAPAGKYISDQLNLKALTFQGSTVGYATRLYAYGKNGMSIESVNDGKAYVDNHSYTDKVIVTYWTDERYTDPQSLKSDALKKLADFAVPIRSYECSVKDLARQTDKYSILSIQMHDKMTLVSSKRGMRVVYSVVRYVEYPDNPEDNIVTLSTVPETIQKSTQNTAKKIEQQIVQTAETIKEETKKEITTRQQAVLDLNQIMTNSLGLYETSETLNDGSVIHYLHNQSTLESSTAIYTRNANGYAWTVGEGCWNNGSPVWQYGYTKEGNAVFNFLSVNDVNVSGRVTAKSGSIGRWEINTDGISKVCESGADKYYVFVSGNMYTPENGNPYNPVFGVHELNSNDWKFYVRSNGELYAKDAHIEGYIRADAGRIGGWGITDDALHASFNDGQDTYLVQMGAGLYRNSIPDSTSFYIGKNDECVFCIRPNGELASWGKRYAGTTNNTPVYADTSIRMLNGEIYTVGTSTSLTISGSQMIATGSEIPYSSGLSYGESEFRKLSLPWATTYYYKRFGDSNYTTIGGLRTSTNGYYENNYIDMWGNWRISGNVTAAASEAVSSDRNAKNSINAMLGRNEYDTLFDNLVPCTFKYNDGASDRTHMGFTSQGAKEAADKANIGLKDFAAVCIAKDTDGKESWSLRYDEFVALNTLQIQKLKKRVSELEALVKNDSPEGEYES